MTFAYILFGLVIQIMVLVFITAKKYHPTQNWIIGKPFPEFFTTIKQKIISLEGNQCLEVELRFFKPYKSARPGNIATEASGSLFRQHRYMSGHRGTLVYIVGDELQIGLDRVADTGGSVLQPKPPIFRGYGCSMARNGYEGNQVAFYSQK